jgi:hypothetical protein
MHTEWNVKNKILLVISKLSLWFVSFVYGVYSIKNGGTHVAWRTFISNGATNKKSNFSFASSEPWGGRVQRLTIYLFVTKLYVRFNNKNYKHNSFQLNSLF